MIEVRELGLKGVFEILPKKHGDHRGFFSETYNAAAMKTAGFDLVFIQDNHSFSASAGVLRGLHYQLPPFAQDKLVRVTRGAIYDLVVDIRRGSPTFGEWVALEISAWRWNQILVPKGFAHGFVTLEPDTEVLYKVTAHYSAQHDRSLRFDDPAIAASWPVFSDGYVISDKDLSASLLKDADLFD